MIAAVHLASVIDARTRCGVLIDHDTHVSIRLARVTCLDCMPKAPTLTRRDTRLAIFIRDCLKRSTWVCPQALTRYAITSANSALMARFK